MRDYTIGPDASGQRLDRYLIKLLPEAGKSFLQKMIRKKRIKLNGGRAEASAMLHDGDIVRLYFSDETITAFSGGPKQTVSPESLPSGLRSSFNNPVFEDEDYLVISKPAGVLSQPDHTGELSAAEAARAFIHGTETFSPAPLTRLDRNTSGVLLFPKNYEAQKRALASIRDRDTDKEYLTVVSGTITSPGELRSRLSRDGTDMKTRSGGDDSKEAVLEYRPLASADGYTLLLVRLLTGRTHQIRAQFEQNGTPVAGDTKYGSREVNRDLRERFGVRSQLLHAYRYALRDDDGTYLDVSAPLPDDFAAVIRGIFSGQTLGSLLAGASGSGSLSDKRNS